MDFADPVEIRSQIFQRTKRRPARRWFFLLGIAIGLIWGCVLTVGFRDLQAAAEKPAPAGWNTAAFTYKGFENGRYFIQNRSGRDFRLNPANCFIMQRTSLGLVHSDAKPEAVFIPNRETTGISFNPPLEGDLVLFDMGGKLRIDLHGGQND